MSPRRTMTLALAVGVAASGCAAYQQKDAFSYRFEDNAQQPTRRVVSRLPEPRLPTEETNALGTPLAVGTTDGDRNEAIAFDVSSGEELWRAPVDALTRPEVLGDVVVLSVRGEEGEEVIALDLRSGQELWREETEGMAFVGGDREGDTIVYVVSVGAAGGERRESRIVAVNARTGAEIWDHELEGIIGDPATQAGYVFVPWERQNIAILDLRTGIEQARLRSTDDVISWVEANPAGVFYGSKGIYRLTEESYTGTKEGSVYREPPVPDPPGDPLVAEDAFMPKPGTRSARGRIRILFEPTVPSGEQPIPVLNDSFYFFYYRFVFAFDDEQNLRWVRIVDEEIAGAQVVEDGLLTMGAEGALHLLDETTGNDRWTADVEASLASVTLLAHGFSPEGEAGEPRDLRTSLNEVALDPDNRLVPARAYAIQLLAQIEEPEITRDLLDLYAQRSMPGALREAIGTALRSRSQGSEYLIEALDQHYDFVEDTEAPPLGLIVPSLIENEQTQAVPGLIGQMMDHETPMEVLPLVVQAVVELGDDSVVPALREFLRLYHADSTFEEQPQALAVAAQGMFEKGGPEGREMLQGLVADASTLEGLSAHVQGMFETEQQQAEARAREEAEAAARAAEEARRREEAARPLRLSQEQINQAFAAHADALRECIMDELGRNPRLAQVRLVFIMENDGSARDFTFAPNNEEFVACMQPKVQAVEFPLFRQRRQRGDFTISVRGGQPQQEQVAEQPTGPQPWWVKYRARGIARPTATASADATPWWVERRAPQQPAQQPTAAATQQPAQQQPAQQRPTQQQPGQQQPGQQQPAQGGGEPWWMRANAAQQQGGQQRQPQRQQPAQEQPPQRQQPPAQPEEEEDEEEPAQPPPQEEENPWWLPAE